MRLADLTVRESIRAFPGIIWPTTFCIGDTQILHPKYGRNKLFITHLTLHIYAQIL